MKDKERLEKFALKVRTLRLKQGLSQEKLAEKSGLHRTYIGMVERQERTPSLLCIYKISDGLGVTPQTLFDY